MPRYSPQTQSLLSGLNTKASPAGLPLGQHEVMKNVRFNEGAGARRQGMQRLDICTGTGDAILLNPDSSTHGEGHVEIPLHLDAHQLPPQFTIDIVVNPDELPSSGDIAQILGFKDGEDPFTLYWTSDNKITFTLTDTGSTQYSLTSTSAYSVSAPDTSIPIRIVRDGTDLTMMIAGAEEATRTDLTASLSSIAPASSLIIGSDQTGTEVGFSGIVDDLRIFHTALDGHKRAWVEWHDPRHPALVAYYRFDEQVESGWESVLIDDSRYGNAGLAVGGVSFTTALVQTLEPVTGIHQYQHSSGTRRVLIAAGQGLYETKVV